MDQRARNIRESEPWFNPHRPAVRDLGEFTSFTRIGEARKHPNTALTMEADCGGQPLLACPIADVHADNATLYRLLSDLESITWGRGFDKGEAPRIVDAQMGFIKTNDPTAPTEYPNSFWRIGARELWIHQELDSLNLKPQLESILAGRQPRLNVAPEFPYEELDDPRDIHPYFYDARVQIRSGSRARNILNWPACAVKITREPLQQLAELLESSIKLPSVPLNITPGPTTVSITRRGAFGVPNFNAALLPRIHVQRVVLALLGELSINLVAEPRELPSDLNNASVRIESESLGQCLLTWPACAVKINRDKLQQLGDLLESSIKVIADLRAKRAKVKADLRAKRGRFKSSLAATPRVPADFAPGPTAIFTTRQEGALAGPSFNTLLLSHIRIQRVVLALQGELPIERVTDNRPLSREDLVCPR